MNSKSFSRRQFLAATTTVCVAGTSVSIFAKTKKPIQRIVNEDMVHEIWETVKANKPLTTEMIRHIEDLDESGETVVVYPVYNGEPKLLKKLLECGADPTYVSPYGDVRQVLRDNFNGVPQEIVQECFQVLHDFGA